MGHLNAWEEPGTAEQWSQTCDPCRNELVREEAGPSTLHQGPLNGLGFGAGVRYVGQAYGSADNELKVPARTLFDAATHYDIANWRLALNASNLFNKEYLAYCNNGFLCYWGATRNVMASATYKW